MLENFWKKFGEKEKPPAKEPSFEELKAALPIELQEEFEELGHKIEGLAGGGDFGEMSYRDEDLTPEDRVVEKRFDELTKLARKNYFGIGKE